jgi:hypothetical protein
MYDASSSPAEGLGYALAPVIIPAVVYLIVYIFLRVVKKRKPTRRETVIILMVTLALVVIGYLGSAAQDAEIQY